MPFEGKSSKAGDAIEGAMKEWEKKSCVKFVPRSNQRVYITFIQDKRDRYVSRDDEVFFSLNVHMSYKSRKCMVIDGVPIGGSMELGGDFSFINFVS